MSDERDQDLLRRNLSQEVSRRLASTREGAGAAQGPATPAPTARTDPVQVKAALQQQLLEELGRSDVLGRGEDAVRAAVTAFVERIAAQDDDLVLNEDERRRLAADLQDEALGVGPLAPLMADPAVTDILVNAPDKVYVERHGRLERTGVRFRDDEHIQRLIERMAMRVGRRIDPSWPMVDMRLPDGSRVNATLPPASVDGPTVSIRRFGQRRLRARDLLHHRSLDEAMRVFLEATVRGRLNLLISGGTGAGKSTLLGALCEAIPADERIVTIEDTAELILDQEHVVRLESRPANVEGHGQITARDLLINALRMRPSRLIVGEVRAGEALDMLQAMNTGHEGGLTTVHANSPRDALARLETLALMAGTDLPSRALREQIAAAIHLVVHVARGQDGVRRVESIAELTGLEGTVFQTQELFHFVSSGVEAGKVVGRFEPTGLVPRCREELARRGLDLPLSLFRGPA